MRAVIFLVTFSAPLLAACGFTPEGTVIRDAVIAKGARAYDEGLVNAETFLCQVASVGSIKRRYGRSRAAAEAWRDICDGQEGVDLIGPAAP